MCIRDRCESPRPRQPYEHFAPRTRQPSYRAADEDSWCRDYPTASCRRATCRIQALTHTPLDLERTLLRLLQFGEVGLGMWRVRHKERDDQPEEQYTPGGVRRRNRWLGHFVDRTKDCAHRHQDANGARKVERHRLAAILQSDQCADGDQKIDDRDGEAAVRREPTEHREVVRVTGNG